MAGGGRMAGERPRPACSSRLARIVQTDSAQAGALLVPTLALLDIQEQVHRAVQQTGQVLPGTGADGLDAAALVANQDGLVARPADINGDVDPHRAVLALLEGLG